MKVKYIGPSEYKFFMPDKDSRETLPNEISFLVSYEAMRFVILKDSQNNRYVVPKKFIEEII